MALYLLIGRRFSKELADHVFRGDRSMKESVTYQAVLSEGRVEGRVEEAKRIIIRQASKRFGPASTASLSRLEGVGDPERLEELADRVLTAEGWDDLLASLGSG